MTATFASGTTYGPANGSLADACDTCGASTAAATVLLTARLTTKPSTTRSRTMLLMHEELARAQCSARRQDLQQSMRMARLAAARRRERRVAATRRRVQLALAAAR